MKIMMMIKIIKILPRIDGLGWGQAVHHSLGVPMETQDIIQTKCTHVPKVITYINNIISNQIKYQQYALKT